MRDWIWLVRAEGVKCVGFCFIAATWMLVLLTEIKTRHRGSGYHVF